jgi:malonyl-CoA decarboxylase
MNVGMLGELIATISERGRRLIDRRGENGRRTRTPEAVIALSEDLLSHRGEASGTARASEILEAYARFTPEDRAVFFEALAGRFGIDPSRLGRAIDAYRAAPGEATAQALHLDGEPRRQELFRRLNLAPGGTQALVDMRTHLLAALKAHPHLAVVDRDLVHLFTSWFNRGFLVVKRIDWTTPAHILEKIIAYEAVHAIRDWDDLRRRLQPADRRCFAFFHPALADEPLIFVEVALTREIPDAIGPLLAAERPPLAARDARTAVFYSISNCQTGLKGISFGHFLIKQVAEELRRDLPDLETFVTLSPVPGFARWLKIEREGGGTWLSPEEKAALDTLDARGAAPDEKARKTASPVLMRAAARYLLEAKTPGGRPIDPVARFHLGNGARLERIDLFGDLSTKGLAESHGVMVNYLYDLERIEKNHEAYAETGFVAAAPAVRKALKKD